MLLLVSLLAVLQGRRSADATAKLVAGGMMPSWCDSVRRRLPALTATSSELGIALLGPTPEHGAEGGPCTHSQLSSSATRPSDPVSQKFHNGTSSSRLILAAACQMNILLILLKI